MTLDFSKYQNYVDQVNEEIYSVLDGDPAELYQAARHIIEAGGKRVRPLLCILSCNAVEGTCDQSIGTASAVELIHTFTLIHDDIMDNDEMRRGNPAVHRVYGPHTAILAGDLLFSKAFQLCDDETFKILSRASAEICEGQEMDISFEDRVDVSEEEYMKMVTKKTAVLLEAATEAGAVMGHGVDAEIENLAVYGKNMGIAFQIKDDLLGAVGDEERLGKPVGSDVIEGKKNILSIKALELLEGKEEKELLEIMKKEENTDEELQKTLDYFKSSGALKYCNEKMAEYYEISRDALMNIQQSQARDNLEEMADFIVNRDH